MLYRLGEREVEIQGDDYFVAENASVIGSVRLENNASVWFNAVIRGDNALIIIGENSNVQDGAVLHTDPEYPLTIGSNVTVGHMAMLHGCSIGEGSLVGIGAVILNGAVIGRNCLIGAKALVGEGKEIPDGSVVLGMPGKVRRQVTEADLRMLARIPPHYVNRWKHYKANLRPDPRPDEG